MHPLDYPLGSAYISNLTLCFTQDRVAAVIDLLKRFYKEYWINRFKRFFIGSVIFTWKFDWVGIIFIFSWEIEYILSAIIALGFGQWAITASTSQNKMATGLVGRLLPGHYISCLPNFQVNFFSFLLVMRPDVFSSILLVTFAMLMTVAVEPKGLPPFQTSLDHVPNSYARPRTIISHGDNYNYDFLQPVSVYPEHGTKSWPRNIRRMADNFVLDHRVLLFSWLVNNLLAGIFEAVGSERSLAPL